MLYCLNHKEFVDENHECESKYIIYATENMSNIADKLNELGFRLSSATCSVSERIGYPGQWICINIAFDIMYNKVLLSELPKGWEWFHDLHKVVITKDRWGREQTENGDTYCSLSYTKRINYKDIPKAEKKAIRMIKEFLSYLNTYDRDGLWAVMTLLDS